ncbi:MAG: transketolase [Rhabdochlamydiaceae bacterium]|nr:transketolase [Candidatus Amphrikana amoebophyrae]
MDEDEKKMLAKVANIIRALSIEGVQKANSGHPGLPLGCAEIGAYLYGKHLNHNPKNSKWFNRDRFVLSAGHGSMLLYSCLHLAGFKIALDDLKSFRQFHSITPGHPEYHETDGVEATTGPLGQGIGNAVGQALGSKLLAEQFNTSRHKIVSNKVYCLCGDGCLMEGISHEACGYAGHVGLDNFVLIFDSNKITLDGPLSDCGSEDTAMRFRAYGFDVFECDGNNLTEFADTLNTATKDQTKPVIIIAHTIIGKGSPNKQGTHKAHGSPLGEEEMELTKKNLGLPEENFSVPGAVTAFFEAKLKKDALREEKWNQMFSEWSKEHPELANKFNQMKSKELPANLENTLKDLEIEGPIAGRSASQVVIGKLAELLPHLYGGSADLSGSDCTMMKAFPIVEKGHFKGRNMKYGIREFGMAAIAAGLYQTDLITPFVGTFLTFSDYMRNAIRLAALSHYHVIYQFTHDSVFLGEDGPTHQPVEHYMSLRAIPNLHFFRPADAWEVKGAWMAALKYAGPSAIALTRQKLPHQEGAAKDFASKVSKGAYILKKESGKCDFCIIATGSEVALAMDVAKELETRGKQVRVVSMPCWELFTKQDKAYIDSVVGGDLGRRVSIEAGITTGWQEWTGPEGINIGIDHFGLSAPMSEIAKEFGFTVEAVLSRLLAP